MFLGSGADAVRLRICVSVYSRFGSQEFTAQNVFQGLDNAVRLSQGWARWDANLVMQTGSVQVVREPVARECVDACVHERVMNAHVRVYVYVYLHEC